MKPPVCRHTAPVVCLLGALFVPDLRAQSPEEFQQLKSMVEQMQQTIKMQNARIVDLERRKAAPASEVKRLSKAAKSPEIEAVPAMAAEPSQIRNRKSLYDQQVGAPRPGVETLDPKYTGFLPIPNSPVIVKINARPRVDVTADNRNSGSPSKFVTGVIPIKGSAEYGGGTQSNINSRASSLSFDAKGPDLPGSPRFYYETDFLGGGLQGGMTPRVKQLYGQYHNITAGFATSVFEDADAWPDTVDNEGPNSVIFARQPGIRYQRPFGENWQMNFGVQQPNTDLDPGIYADASAVNHAPDAGFNIRWEETDAGHVQLGTIFRELGANSRLAGDQSVFGWGLNLSGNLQVGSKDSLQFQATYGQGIFHFMNDNFVNNDVTYDEDGNLKAIPMLGLMAGYTHHWSERFRSTATFGYIDLENERDQGPDAYRNTYYGSFNLMYQLRERLTFGFEGLYGRKDVQDDGTGDVFRIQCSLMYSMF